MNEKSYSHIDNQQIFLDKKLDKLFEGKQNGIYIYIY